MSVSRIESARATRTRILDAARRLFTTRGYSATTMKAIALEAGVAVQTMYFTFGNKRTVLKELIDVSVAGDDEPVPTLERAWFRSVIDEPDPARLIRRYVHHAGTIYARVSDVLEVLRAGASFDAELAAQWATNQDHRMIVQGRVVDAVANRGQLRAGLTVQAATDAVFALLGPELFRVLVVDRGWSGWEWEEWVGGLVCGHLLSTS